MWDYTEEQMKYRQEVTQAYNRIEILLQRLNTSEEFFKNTLAKTQPNSVRKLWQEMIKTQQ